MRPNFRMLLIVTALCSLPVCGTTLYYRDTAAGQFVNMHILRSPSGDTMESMNQRADSMIYLLDTNCVTQSWLYFNTRNGTALSANRLHDTLTAIGVFNGVKFSKAYKIDGNPWFQVWSLPAEVFARSGRKSIRFWSIDPTNMQRVVRFEFTMLKTDTIGYQGKNVPVHHVQVTLTGIGSAFFRGDYWIRETDNRVIRSRMPRGIGRKPTTSELLKESAE